MTLDESVMFMRCREALVMTNNLGFVMDAETIKRIGQMYGHDGATVMFGMRLESTNAEPRGEA
jgi:hypothetical protein